MKKFLITIGVVLLVLLVLYLIPSPLHSTIVDPIYESPNKYEMLELTNIERIKVGVKPLIGDIRLDKSSQIKADDMVNNNYFEHIDKNGKHGYEYINEVAPKLCNGKAENIRENSWTRFNTSEITTNAFVTSPKHYEAMINPKYSLVGFGINGTKIVVHFCELML